MTREEAILLSAYTGYLLTPDFSQVHKFCEDTLGRPIWTHEFADRCVQKEIQEKLRPQIMELVQNIAALRPVSREQVERMRGEWKHYLPPLGAGNVQCRCTKCGRTPDVETPFCAWCGAPMTDEAVEMVMERINEMEGTENGLG